MKLYFLDKTDELANSETHNQSVDTSTNYLNCSVCNVNLQDQEELRSHLISKKHKKTYRVLEEQQRINKQCGLYIKGNNFSNDSSFFCST